MFFCGRRMGLCTLSKVCKTWGIVALAKTMAGVGHLKRICKDAFPVAGTVQETCWSEMFKGQGADFLRGVDFWSVKSFAWQVQHFVRPGITFAWQTQYFRQMEWKNRRTHCYEDVGFALNFPSWKEVSQNYFVFDVAHSLPTSKTGDVSQNCVVLDVVKLEHWGSLAEMVRFRRCTCKTPRKSYSIAALSMMSTFKCEQVSQNCFRMSREFAGRRGAYVFSKQTVFLTAMPSLHRVVAVLLFLWLELWC